MNDPLPSVTVLIAARPEQAEIQAVTAGKLLDYPREKLQILARGKQPSIQRNAGIRAAKGELIYFLDDDLVAPPGNLRRAAAAFSDAKVQMVGGPNLCPTDAPFLERVFALVHSSWLAFGPSRARYTKVGVARASSEKELILCNLAARRAPLLELGGFNELLYPNEENALMDELQKRGPLIYDPEFMVLRRPRRSLKSFVKMLLNYGRGRAEQVRLNPTLRSAPNFVPPLFCVYLISLAIFYPLFQWVALVPLGFYLLGVLVQAAMLAAQGGLAQSVCAVPLIVLTHLVYGIGFARGLFTRLKANPTRTKTEVVLEEIPL